MDRRSFLIGGGAILTAAYVDKANWFLRNKNAVVPFAEVEQASETLYFVDLGNQNYDLRLGSPNFEVPDLTYLQWLSTYENPKNIDYSINTKISEEDLMFLMGYYDLDNDQLNQIAPADLYQHKWELNHSPFAKAYYYLRDLDLFNERLSDGELIGDLEFIHQHQMWHGYTVGVSSEDPITASLLQGRLIELNHKITVQMVDGLI